MSDLCISVRSLKRADYLEACLRSLESNTDLRGVDFYFLQDGGVNPYSGLEYAREEEIEASLRVFEESDLPNKTIFQSKWNMGCALQKHHQLTTLFPRYKYVVLVDNDLVFNRYYIKTLKVLFKQYRKDRKAGILQTSFRNTGSNFQDGSIAKAFEDRVEYGFSHRWELGFWRESWKQIAPLMKPCFELTAKCDFRELLYNKERYQSTRDQLMEIYGTDHADHSLEVCAKRKGYRGLHTLTLRHKTVGRRGIYSFRKDRFDRENYDRIKLWQVGNVNKYIVSRMREIEQPEEFAIE